MASSIRFADSHDVITPTDTTRVTSWPLVAVVGFHISNEFPDGNYRIQDLELAERLEYARDRSIRKNIKSLHEEGLLPGICVRYHQQRTQMPTGGTREDTVEEYWLTEGQALFVTSQSRTDRPRR